MNAATADAVPASPNPPIPGYKAMGVVPMRAGREVLVGD